MRSFEYFTPTRVVFGKDTHLKIATLLKEQNCKKVLIHYGSGSVRRSGLLDKVKASLDDALDLFYKGVEEKYPELTH
jgi:alcohol dehydrogenase YqhD (iron-dependent ADH family)